MKGQASRRAAEPPRWMRFLLDLPFVGVAICDARDRRWTRLNERFCAMTGYRQPELLRMNWRSLFHPADRSVGDAAIARLLSRRTSTVRVQLRLLRKDGRVVPVEIGASFAPTGSGKANHIVKLHVPNGYDILRAVDFPWPIADMAWQHHERLDGSGYPRALKGDQIVPEARILAVADVIEAMSSHRPYRAAVGIEPALEEIELGAGPRYDADVSACAIGLFRRKNFQIPA